MNHVQIECRQIAEPDWLDRLAPFVQAVLHDLGRDGWEVSILLCDDAAMAVFNQEYRGKSGPTDVLSFPQAASAEEIPESGPFVAGDIIVSLDSLASNAEYFRVPVDEEFKRLLIHGILHLSGLDHDTIEADEPMLVEQERLVAMYRGETIIPS